MARNSFYILSFGFTFSTLNFKFPSCLRQPPKPPNQPKLSTNYDSIITNKANLLDAQMNVNNLLTKEYEDISNCKLCENKPNTNPIYRGVASGEDGTNTISHQRTTNPEQRTNNKQTQFQRQKMLPRLTINGRRVSLRYLRSFCADKIREAIYLNDQSKHCTKIPHRSGV